MSATKCLDCGFWNPSMRGHIEWTNIVNVNTSRRFNVTVAILLIATSLIALIGCARRQPALDGTQWRLTEWTLSSLDARDFDITAGFGDGKVSGHSGVNSYGAPYTVGARQSFKVGSIA